MTKIHETNLNAALALHNQGQLEQAENIYKEILKLEPQYFDALQLLASLTLQKKDYLAAVALFDDALKVNSNHVETLHNKGNALFMLKRYEEALELYNQTLQLKPDYVEVLNNRGVILRNLKRFEEALESYDCAINIKPDYADALNNRGNVLRDLKRNEEALASYKRTLEIKPDFADAWHNLGNLFNENSDDELAFDAYQNAAKIDPKNWQYQFNLAQSFHLLGDIEGSRAAFANTISIKEEAGIRIRYETLLPVVMLSEEAITDTRDSLELSFKQLLERKLKINDPMSDITVTPLFHLAYHGECNVDLMRGYTDLIRAACPSVDYVSPHCLAPLVQQDKIRIGFTSKFFYEHTIGKFFRGILKNINRSQFEIFVFVTTTKQDEVTSWIINHSDHFEVLPPTLAEARQHIANHSLDILVYTDIGMDPFTYYLAFSRLAPVQCVLYGHPDTTGIPTIDYYLSGGACESETADSHYTEKLVRLDSNSTYTYYYRPNNRATQKTRADFNLPESLHLYTCAQSLFKIHPEMDAVFDEILARDLEGRLVLFDDVKQRRIELFKKRLQKRMRHYDRVIFLPRMTLPDFLQVLNLSDALLDSFHFCGGNTSFDSFAAESPIVTLPGEFMRGRQTYGLYKRMGFTDLVADDKADYIDKALRLGTDVEFRKNMRDKLAARVSVIFEDSGVVHALEQFFISTQARKIMTTTQAESSQANFDPHVEPWRFLDSSHNNHLTFLSQDYAPRALIDLLETSPTLAIDIGCFVGATGAYIKQKWADCRVVGIEPVADAAAQARTRVDAVFEGFFEDMPVGEAGVMPGNVDLAVFADVLEHMRHPWAALRHVREWLSPNGVVLVSLPNIRNLNILKELVNGSFNYRPAGILDITHIRFFTRLDAIKMFEQTGFSVEKMSMNFDPSLVNLLESVPKDHKIKVDVGSKMSINDVDFADAQELCALQFYFLLRPNKNF